jgi:hypothetical protein
MMAGNGKKKGCACTISFDIKKAFDLVPFGKLMLCLKTEYGVPDCILSWLRSYFTERTQVVRVDGSYSTVRQVRGGVVQGSVIGPLLFLAYFDKVIPDNTGDCVSVKFADDLLLIHPLKSAADEISIQRIVDQTVNSMLDKGLTVHEGKCCYDIFSESSIPYAPSDPVTVNGIPIQRANGLTYLGVTLDRRLTWAANTRSKITKTRQGRP